MYLSGSPLSEYDYISKLMHTKTIGSVNSISADIKDGDNVKLLCILQNKKLHQTKKGDKMCFLSIADDTGEIRAVVFPELFAICANKLNDDSVLLISGKISVTDETVTVICGSVTAETEFARLTANMKLCIKTVSSGAAVSSELMKICQENKGTTPVCFYLTDLKKTVLPKNKLSLDINSDSYNELLKLFDASQIGLIQ